MQHYPTASMATHSYIHSKLLSSVPSNSPPWSDHSMGPGSPYASDHSASWAPSAPSISSVPLPGSPIPSTRNSSHHGISSPHSNTRFNAPPPHPVLRHNPAGNLLFDITQPFMNLRFRPVFPQSVMAEQAIMSPSSSIYINFPGFPRWSLEVTSHTGVTVHDVLANLYELFHRRVGKDEFSAIPPHIQSSATSAFNARTARDPAERARGMKRMDFIFPRVFFVGFSMAADGRRWDINLSQVVA
jgi:hypothetical protein